MTDSTLAVKTPLLNSPCAHETRKHVPARTSQTGYLSDLRWRQCFCDRQPISPFLQRALQKY